MAWIESHTSLEKHHKLIRFQTAMRWSRNEAVGFLHRFWWSVLEVSPSGDVTALTSPEVMSETLNMKLDVVQDAILKLEDVGFLHRVDGRLLVKNWLDYAHRYLSQYLYKRDKKMMKKVRELHGLPSRNLSATSRRQVGDTIPTKPTVPTKPKPPPGFVTPGCTVVASGGGVRGGVEKVNGNDFSTTEDETLRRALEFSRDPGCKAFLQKALRKLGPGLLEEAVGEVKMREMNGSVGHRAKYLSAILSDWMRGKNDRHNA